MGKSDEAKLAKLIRKTMAKAEQPKGQKRRRYDPTLPVEVEDPNAEERKEFFSEMKRREF